MYEEIKAEIERRIKAYDVSIEKSCGKKKSMRAERDSWKWAECKSLLSFIESRQQPSEDLEKAAGEYENGLDAVHFSWDGPSVAFKAGAHWQKEQMMKDAEWSEEDEKMYKSALWHISYSVSNGEKTDCNCLVTDWLKSIRAKFVKEDAK